MIVCVGIVIKTPSKAQEFPHKFNFQTIFSLVRIKL